jgi:Rab GTPase-binding effector protein 1
MENIKAVATVSESTKQEAIDQVRSQWQEEVASLQAIMKGNPPGAVSVSESASHCPMSSNVYQRSQHKQCAKGQVPPV